MLKEEEKRKEKKRKRKEIYILKLMIYGNKNLDTVLLGGRYLWYHSIH